MKLHAKFHDPAVSGRKVFREGTDRHTDRQTDRHTGNFIYIDVKNLRAEDLTDPVDDIDYGFDDVDYGDVPDFSLDPDHNEKVEERRRQRQNEIDHEIGSEQDRLLANYLQKLEDNQK